MKEVHSEAADGLRETERAISDADHWRLQELIAERGEVQAALAGLDAQARQLAECIALQQAQMAGCCAGSAWPARRIPCICSPPEPTPNQSYPRSHYLALFWVKKW